MTLPGLKPFIRRRQRRIIGYAVLVAFVVTAMILTNLGINAWQEILFGLEGIFRSETGADVWLNIQYFFLAYLIPVFIVVLIAFLAASAVGILAAAIVTCLVPARFLGFIDFVLYVIFASTIINASGFGAYLSDELPRYGAFCAQMLIFALPMSLVWDRLPVGFTYRGTAKRIINLGKEPILARLIPDHSTETELADAGWLQGQGKLKGETDASVEMIETGQYRVHQDSPLRHGPKRDTDFVLSEIEDGKVELGTSITIKGLGPLDFWELWSRPFAEDYADHLQARLHGTKDLSIHGVLMRRYRKKRARKQSKLQAA